MSTYTQTLLDDFPTLETLLGRETGIDSYYIVTSTFSLATEYVEELSLSCITNRLGKGMIFHHATDIQVFHCNKAVRLAVLPGNLEMEVTPLPLDFQVRVCRALTRLASSMTALVSSSYCALLASERLLRGAIVARIVNGVAFAISQERFQATSMPIGSCVQALEVCSCSTCFISHMMRAYQ